MRRPLRTLLVMVCLALIVVPALAEAPSPPPFYAITNVRVVTGTGTTLEGATVVLAEGIIEAVGTNVNIPADAWVIDGEGLTVYPGLIDAMTNLAQKSEESDDDDGDSRGGGSDAPPVRGPEDRPQTWTWRDVADELAADSKLEKRRAAGITSVVTSPEEGLFAGQAALINSGDAEPRDLVVAASVAHRINFRATGGFRSYPGSLMGALGYIKQVFEDTRHYTQVKADYAKDPSGRIRPAHDRALEPLEIALANRTPFLIPGNLPRHIDRALAIADDYKLNAIVYGAHGAYQRIEALQKAKTAVLVSTDWPEAEKDRDPDARTPLRTLIHRRLAVTTPAALAAGEVPFAFYSDGGSESDLLEGVRAAVEAGLSNEDALRALTLGPARIFGVGNRLGSVERGKIANLVLASDWPWADGVEVKAVFVDGRKYEEREDDEPKDPPAQDVSGTWELKLETPGGARDVTATLEMDEDGMVKGELSSQMGDAPADDGRMSGDNLRFETTREMGGRTMTATWSLTVEGEKVAGTMSAGPMAMDVSGERTEKPAEGDEAGEDEAEDEAPAVATDELRDALGVVQGKVRSMDTFAITNATVWTLTGDPIQNGTVVVQDGKIKAVGANVSVPGGAEVIDAEGGAVIPGIIDCHSHLAIEGGVNESSLAVTSMVSIGDIINPDDMGIYRALAGGVTSANVLHGSANPIGGRNQVIKFRWGQDAEGMRFQGAPKGIKFALGENPKRSNFRNPNFPQRYPQTRMGVMDVIRQAFTDAVAYRKAWEDFEKGRKRGGVKPERPRRDFKLEALVEILDGERRVHSHCYRADEILQLMRLAEEFGFKISTLQHVLEGYKVADEMAAHGAGGSTFSDWWGYKVEAYDAIPHNAALMSERGVVVSINSDSSEEIRHLNQEAGKCVKWGGMSELEALKMVTLNPAIQLGIDNRVGSIEVGKDADLVLYDGHPLAIRSVVQKTWIDGDLYFDLENDRVRQGVIDDLVERMEGKDDEDEEESADEANTTSAMMEVKWADDAYSCREDH